MGSRITGAIAIGVAIGISSFTSLRWKDKWFTYNGSTNSTAQVFNPVNYAGHLGEPMNPADATFILAYIHVENSTEVHATGQHAGLPKVDIGSDIQSDLITYVAGRIWAIELINRIYIC